MSDKRNDTGDFDVIVAFELPFWIPIESGEYSLDDKRIVSIHNDLWLVITGNIIDGPHDRPFEYMVSETLVTDQKLIEHNFGESAQYYHREKMKTTFTRVFNIIPNEGVISAQPGTERWQYQLETVVFNLINRKKYQDLLRDINSFIDLYCSYIGTTNPAREARNVSFYDTTVRALVTMKTQGALFLNPIQIAPDMKTMQLPHPRFRVQKKGNSDLFRKIIHDNKTLDFHQLQWAKALNHNREKRYQEALLSGSIALESLIHRFLIVRGFHSKEKRMKEIQGIARWLRNIETPNLSDECKDVAKLWNLRNEIIHEQKVLSTDDIETITSGIASLATLRDYFLQTIDSDLRKNEQIFTSFLELIPLGPPEREPIDGLAPITIGWRREKDHYQKVISPQNSIDDEEDNPQ